MAHPRPLALVTNDDGIDSPFLPVLIEALAAHFRVRFAIPLREQSWIGRALSRHRTIEVADARIGDARGWTVDGTPSDCVNLAFGHLLADELPDVVVAGLNIGYNITLPMLLSSGTLAGAIEGVHWGIPSVAASQALPPEHFAALDRDRSHIPAEIVPAVEAACAHAAATALKVSKLPATQFEVHNLNYPHTMCADTPIRMTIPAEVRRRGLFQPAATPGTYQFAYNTGELEPTKLANDRKTLDEGDASWSRLNFSRLAGSIELPV